MIKYGRRCTEQNRLRVPPCWKELGKSLDGGINVEVLIRVLYFETYERRRVVDDDEIDDD